MNFVNKTNLNIILATFKSKVLPIRQSKTYTQLATMVANNQLISGS